MKVKTMVKTTGEELELSASTPDEIVLAWRTVKAYEDAAKDLKEQLKKIYDRFQNDEYETTGYMFRTSYIQRMVYDKAVLRSVIKDEDALDTLLIPDKKAVDNYLKENLETLGDASTLLRNSMVETGKPFSQVRLEKIK